jgi:hypothetical protein
MPKHERTWVDEAMSLADDLATAAGKAGSHEAHFGNIGARAAVKEENEAREALRQFLLAHAAGVLEGGKC